MLGAGACVRDRASRLWGQYMLNRRDQGKEMTLGLKVPPPVVSCLLPPLKGGLSVSHCHTQRVTMKTKETMTGKYVGKDKAGINKTLLKGRCPCTGPGGPMFSLAQGSKLCQGGRPGQTCQK